tara:strand:- start:3888 stop:6071 length:2184 start_codon:yes stop_codon:yes gene_type:complete
MAKKQEMMDEREILNIVGQELAQSAGGDYNDFIEGNRKAALASYLGQPDGHEVEGRSSVVSTDVADAIEWIMPEVMKAFTQNNEVVTFDPCFDGDEKQAELESQYVYDILMKDNTGFITLHQFFKDALMQKNGFIKVYYNDDVQETAEHYTGLTEPELKMLVSDPEIELSEYSQDDEGPIPTFDVRVTRTTTKSKVQVDSVAPEDFRVNRQHNSVDLSTARFTSHIILTTTGDLVAEGYDKEVVDSIPSAVTDDDRDYRFYMMGETVFPDGDINADPSMRPVEIAESTMWIDINGDGKPEMWKITTAGGDNADTLLDMEEVSVVPFISATAILMSHKLFGLSIYDRLRQIQEQKTSLWRNILDNMYLQNNQRTIVVEGQVNLDDLLVSRPGGIIRAKRPDAVQPYQTPPLPSDAYKMMDYLDQVRAGRAGVSPEGGVTDNMIGDRVGSQGVEKMLNQKEELVGLMIRVFAETGIKPLCYMIRDTVIRHQDTAKDYQFRGQWVPVNPSTWRNRTHTTVRVGTGSGNRKEQQGAVTQIMSIQEAILSKPGQALVKEDQVFNAANDFAKFSGMPGVRRYLLDPASPEGKANKAAVEKQSAAAQEQQKAQEQAMAKAQMQIAQAAETTAKAEAMNVKLKSDADMLKNQLTSNKDQAAAETAILKLQLEEANSILSDRNKSAELEYKYYQTDVQAETQRLQIGVTRANAKDQQDTQLEIAESNDNDSGESND